MGSRTGNENEELVKRLFEAFNQRDWDTYRDILTEDVVLHENGADFEGVDSIIEHEQGVSQTYPDASISVENVLASRDGVAVRTRVTGTPLEGTEVEDLDSLGLVFGQIENGRFREIWALTD